MFTIQEIQKAHGKVKSGADFPAYIREIKSMGVTHYEANITDGHIDYHGKDGYTVHIPAKYDAIPVVKESNKEGFVQELRAHQQGKTDFLTFINRCASYGVERWEICMEAMTCTYFDKTGKEMLVEQIPE